MYPPAGNPPDPNVSAPPTIQSVAPPDSLAAKAVADAQRNQQREALTTLKWKPDEIQEWWNRIEASEKRTKDKEIDWDILLDEYMPMVKATGIAEDAKVNAHFRNVHTKIGQVFVRSPEVRLSPQGPMLDQIITVNPQTGMPTLVTPEEALVTKQAVINKYMGPDFIDGLRLMDECLFDQMAWSGISAVKVGYKAVSKPIQRPKMQPGPQLAAPAQPGSVMGLSPTPQAPPQPVLGPDGRPVMETIQVPIYKEWYANRFSPKKLLLDELLKSSRHGKASRWIGMRFFIPRKQAIRDLAVTEEELQAGTEDDRVHQYKNVSAGDTSKDLIGGYELWIRCSIFRDDVIHPQAICQLVFLDGIKDRAIVSRPSPDQTFDEQGLLTQDSLIGFPILVGCLRDLADSPFPPADAAFTNTQVKHMNTHRRQSVRLRDAAVGKYLYDTGAIDDDDLDKIKKGEVGEWIGVKEGLLAQGADKIITTTAQVKASPDDWRTNQMLKADMDETLGISSVGAGAMEDTVRSATEIRSSTDAAAGRQEKEQSRSVAHYLSIVRAIDTLIVRYMQGEDYVSIAGDDGAKKLMKWNAKMINIRCAYDIKPDSQLKVDTARDRQQKMAGYNLLAKDPVVNRIPMVRDLARDFGWDPAVIVLSPEQIAMQSQPPHGGEVSKHASENSGQKPGGPAGDNRNERNPTTPAAAAGQRPSGPPM